MRDDSAVAAVRPLFDQKTSKRSLVVFSHAMERALATGRGPGGPRAGHPALVLGSFQRREYFDPEARRYQAMANSGITVLVTFVGDTADVPDGVIAVALPPEHQLAHVWGLATIDGELGTALIAQDQHHIISDGDTLEQARAFEAFWTFHRRVAAAEARHLVRLLSGLLPVGVEEKVGEIVARAAQQPVDQVEARLAGAAELLVRSVERAHLRTAVMGARMETFRKLAEADELTGLRNRHYLHRFLGPEAIGATLPVAVLLIDVDDLKAVNDRWGHAAGDAALRRVATAIRGATRPQDVAVRWGGDEFVVLLPGANEEQACRVGDRLIKTVRAASMDAPWQEQGLSVSVGVTMADHRRIPLDALDEALYAAKAAGKGQVARAAHISELP